MLLNYSCIKKEDFAKRRKKKCNKKRRKLQNRNKVIIFCIPGKIFTDTFLKSWTDLVVWCKSNNITPLLSNSYDPVVYYARNKVLGGNTLEGINQKSKYKLIELIKNRATFKKDIIKESRNILDPDYQILDQNFIQKKWNEKINSSILEIINLIKNSKNIPIDKIKKSYLEVLSKNEIKIGDGMQSLRLCLIKNPVGPDIFEMIKILGIKESINRLNKNLIEIND